MLAANEFREFLTFYPTHARADYAQFKLGMTFFYQMHGPERDQTETREAIKELTAFVERYPQQPADRRGQGAAPRRARSSEPVRVPVGYFYWRSAGIPARSTASRRSSPAIRSSRTATPSTSTSPTRWSRSSGRPRHCPLRAADRGVRDERVPGRGDRRSRAQGELARRDRAAGARRERRLDTAASALRRSAASAVTFCDAGVHAPACGCR